MAKSSRSQALRPVLDGLVFPEVPRWHRGQLWLCDFQLGQPGATGQVLAQEAEGRARVVLDQVPGGPPTGLAWLADDRLLIVASQGRALLALGPGDAVQRHVDLSAATARGCNEVVVDGSGRAYVGVSQVPPDPRTLTELLLVQPDGQLQVAATGMRFPNGMMITPDGRTLIVAESTGHCLTAFTIGNDGLLRDRREWAPLPGVVPDGPCLDAEGCVWVADAVGRACLRVAEGGAVLDRIPTDEDAFACTLGGEDLRTLFICTSLNPFTGGRPDFSRRPGKVVAAAVDVPGILTD